MLLLAVLTGGKELTCIAFQLLHLRKVAHTHNYMYIQVTHFAIVLLNKTHNLDTRIKTSLIYGVESV